MAIALAWTPLAIDWWIGSGIVEAPRLRAGFWSVSVVLAVWALFSATRPLSSGLVKLQSLLVSLFLVAPFVAEIVIRSGMSVDSLGLRNAKLYADMTADDDYWKLKRGWKPPLWVNMHPVLGWKPRVTEKNPLGILRAPGYVPRRENVVLCFGDSFMEGVTPSPDKIPDQLEQELKDLTVYNCGVGGYGVGQIYLRFLEETPKYDKPIVVVGILTSDLDRTILSVRGAPKPRFRLESGELLLEPPTVPADPKDWDALNPPEIRSYLASMMVRSLRLWNANGKHENVAYRRQEKRDLNRAVIEALVDEAREQDLRLLFIVFPTSRNLKRPTWRDAFLHDLFEELDVPFVDGRQAIKKDMRARGLPSKAYFLEDNHPNPMGNQVFARAIALRAKKLWRLKLR